MKTCKDPYQFEEPPSRRAFPWHKMWRTFFFGAGITTAIWFIQFERGRTAEYESMKAKKSAAEARAEVAENQLQLTLRNGDCGLLLFNIDPDIGPAQLRIIQTKARS